MALWADKYRPKALAKLSYHDDITEQLSKLADSGANFPHLLVYGPSGAGKKTRIMAMLRRLYGTGSVDNLKVDVKTFVTPSNRKLEFNVISSPCHMEITPSDMGNNDRIVIQDLLKEVGQTEALDFSGLFHIAKKETDLKENGEEENDKSSSPQRKFKVVIINESEKLSRDAQAALRRTMEKFSASIRLILIWRAEGQVGGPVDHVPDDTLRVTIARNSGETATGKVDVLFHQAGGRLQRAPPPEQVKDGHRGRSSVV
ncbi:hypothetical protein PMKS-001161 [Pichia membranifaciens]|uniref:AAA+ ATPase domain-containing protein n=1 Tax=Pichia membranifaciens TaxID=4926 RepID=A0A1Q2YE76_9ASCO|nr:hypothetical protein PMKS-001161 [Pichia membranifaciens]